MNFELLEVKMDRFIELVNDAVLLCMAGGALGLGAWGIGWLVVLELSHVHG